MIIFTRTYDFLSWLIPRTMDFPRSQRFVVTRRLQDAALDFQEQIIEANRQRGRARMEHLRQADASLDKVRLYLRLAARWKWLSPGQYQHAAGYVAEVGRLLGGWKKTTRQPPGD
jgi:four helix bundle protein